MINLRKNEIPVSTLPEARTKEPVIVFFLHLMRMVWKNETWLERIYQEITIKFSEVSGDMHNYNPSPDEESVEDIQL